MSALTSNIDKFEELKKVYWAEVAKVGSIIANEIGEEFKLLCEKVPSIKKMGWSQYTPYFNDGDPCDFSSNGYTIAFSDEIDDYDLSHEYNRINEDGNIEKLDGMPTEDKLIEDYSDWEFRQKLYNIILKDLTLEQRQAIREFFNMLHSLDDDLLENTFGDHALIVYVSDGSHEVHEYGDDYHD